MSLQREMSKWLSKGMIRMAPGPKPKMESVIEAPDRMFQNMKSIREKQEEDNIFTLVWENYFFPLWFKFVRGPFERWQQAATVKYLRDHGLMYDDMYSDKEPVIERAIQMLPEDIATARYRRMMRGTHLNYLRFYLPPEEQNYDPLIPYLAPYIEEAKFQMQEEEELLGYHPYDRRLYTGGVTGFGDKEPGTHFLVSFPKMFG